MILMIDNYDSFTYNIVYYFKELGKKVLVLRNDNISLKTIKNINPKYICLSPGPGKPQNSKICIDILNFFSGKIPILGICLGHQVIGEVFGGKIIRAKKIMHGKISKIFHNNKSIFKNIPNIYNAIRYHSLIIKQYSLPKYLEIIAWTKNKEIMSIKHKKYKIYGIQFHPESVLSKNGHILLKNFLNII